MSGRRWTKEEIDFLQDHYGIMSIDNIAKKLGRTTSAIIVKKDKLHLGSAIDSSEYISFNYVTKVLCGSTGSSSRDYLLSIGVPVQKKKIVTKTMLVIKPNKLWKWLEENKYKVNFKHMNEGDFGYPEPEWVSVKRASDKKNSIIRDRQNMSWTKSEEKQLVFLLNQYRFSYKQIAEMLNRTERGIAHKIQDMNLKQRPIKSTNRSFTEEEVSILIEMRQLGYRNEDIAERLHRSVRSIEGKLERLGKSGDEIAI